MNHMAVRVVLGGDAIRVSKERGPLSAKMSLCGVRGVFEDAGRGNLIPRPKLSVVVQVESIRVCLSSGTKRTGKRLKTVSR